MRVTQLPPRTSTTSDSGPGAGRFALGVSTDRHAVTVRVRGELDAASSTTFADALTAAGRERPLVRVDLAETTFIDSAGIRVLVRSMWDLREAGSHLTLDAASPVAENILRITGILDVLKDPAP